MRPSPEEAKAPSATANEQAQWLQQMKTNAPSHEMRKIKEKIMPIVQKAIKCYYEALNVDETFKEARFHAALMLEKIYNYNEALR